MQCVTSQLCDFSVWPHALVVQLVLRVFKLTEHRARYSLEFTHPPMTWWFRKKKVIILTKFDFLLIKCVRVCLFSVFALTIIKYYYLTIVYVCKNFNFNRIYYYYLATKPNCYFLISKCMSFNTKGHIHTYTPIFKSSYFDSK